MNSDLIKKNEEELEKKLSSLRTKEVSGQYSDLAKKYNLPFSDLLQRPISADSLNIINENESKKCNIAIINKRASHLTVAVTDPENTDTKECIESLKNKGFIVDLVMTTPQGLELAWSRYSLGVQKNKFELGAIDINEEELSSLQDQIKDFNDLKVKVGSYPVTKALEVIIAGALKTDASDIHFEPETSSAKLRYRLDGLLHDITIIDKHYYVQILNRIKVVSKLKINVHTSPQDGRFTIREKGTDIEVRASILPGEFGETIVLRLLDPRKIKEDVGELGIREDLLKIIDEQLEKPTGAVITTGPTGSGKTTALYAFIRKINSPDKKVITIEDPIEYHFKGISQTQVDPKRGYGFSDGLRSILRQDPDIILVGEIRDEDTANIAINASLTGHLVLTTLHTNDASGTIPRLVDLGVKPELITSAVNMAIGQRLVRRLCPKCKKEIKLNEDLKKKMAELLKEASEKIKVPPINDSTVIYSSVGCDACNNSGYKGRVGVFEGFTITRNMETAILNYKSVSEIKDAAVKDGMITLLQDAYIKILEGVTTIEEVERVIE